jgi:hypothetical protein
MVNFKTIIYSVFLAVMASVAAENKVVLEASKDTFGRSNGINLNNGGSQYLVIAHAPGIRSIVAFDLSGITNEITAAEFQFRQHNTVDKPLSMVVSPMVQTENNALWNEGTGALGVKGRNAMLGEATFAWRAFRDKAWESMDGGSVSGLHEKGLWQSPVSSLSALHWRENNWVSIQVSNVLLLERFRASGAKIITFGIWGTAGNGTYLISAKESGHAPKLILRLKE